MGGCGGGRKERGGEGEGGAIGGPKSADFDREVLGLSELNFVFCGPNSAMFNVVLRVANAPRSGRVRVGPDQTDSLKSAIFSVGSGKQFCPVKSGRATSGQAGSSSAQPFFFKKKDETLSRLMEAAQKFFLGSLGSSCGSRRRGFEE